MEGADFGHKMIWSLSARRAWIEIPLLLSLGLGLSVALRKESVDRNSPGMNTILYTIASLSARRAWIEIVYPGTWSGSILGRSPQGERG